MSGILEHTKRILQGSCSGRPKCRPLVHHNPQWYLYCISWEVQSSCSAHNRAQSKRRSRSYAYPRERPFRPQMRLIRKAEGYLFYHGRHIGRPLHWFTEDSNGRHTGRPLLFHHHTFQIPIHHFKENWPFRPIIAFLCVFVSWRETFWVTSTTPQ